MPFQQELVMDEEAEKVFGEYLATFHSANGQVLAHLFKQGDRMVAHVQMLRGMEAGEITDPYVGELNQFARDHGFEGKLRIIYAS